MQYFSITYSFNKNRGFIYAYFDAMEGPTCCFQCSLQALVKNCFRQAPHIERVEVLLLRICGCLNSYSIDIDYFYEGLDGASQCSSNSYQPWIICIYLCRFSCSWMCLNQPASYYATDYWTLVNILKGQENLMLYSFHLKTASVYSVVEA